MSPQRPFFLSSFFAAFRQPSTPLPSSAGNKHTTSANTAPTATSSMASAAVASSAATTTTTSYSVSTPANSPGVPSRHPHHHHHHHHHQSATTAAAAAQAAAARLHQHHQAANGGTTAPRGIPIPRTPRRRGSDSSSEGFREVLGADRMYIGGRTAGGEEKFFKLGVVKRVRSGDRLSLDRMSL